MSKFPQSFAGSALNGTLRPSAGPFRRPSGEPAPKGMSMEEFPSPAPLKDPRGGFQLSLSGFGPHQPIEDVRLQIIEELQVSLRGELSREEIADRCGFTVHQMGAWTSRGSGKNISLANAVQIVRATGRPNVLACAAQACGLWLATEQERRDAAIGRKIRELASVVFGEAA